MPPLYSTEIVNTAVALLHFEWIVHDFGGGHFFSINRQHNLRYNVIVAAYTTPIGRSMLHSYGKVPVIKESAVELLQYTHDWDAQNVHGYYITAHNLDSSKFQLEHLKVQD